MKIIKTHTGKIYVDSDKQLEFLTVGDYGKENNIKANFLGLTKEINGVKNTDVDLTDKWVATISTQKGCPMKCKFCDCPKYGFHGNATVEEFVMRLKQFCRMKALTIQKDLMFTLREWENRHSIIMFLILQEII